MAAAEGSRAPDRQGLVLGTLILVAAVANLNLSVANVALPSIGTAFDAGQTQLNLVAVGYSFGLAGSVLYLGALGDRYGRKMMLVAGMALSIPASLLAALAPSVEVLIVARVLGGVAAGMAYPTTLALITALWSGPGRTKSIALWSGLGGAIAALGPLVSGALLEHFDWGSVFAVTLPLALLAFVLAQRIVPAHVNETTDPVDNLGGILSVVLVAALILGINFAAVPNAGAAAAGLGIVALAAGVAFVLRQRRARTPLYDLEVAGRRVFWVAAIAGIIVFGIVDGVHVHRPAVPPERARLLVAGRRRLDPARGPPDGRRRAAIGQARRGEGRSIHAAVGLRLLPAGVRRDAGAVERGNPVLGGGSRLRPDGDRRRLRRHAGLALADGVGARQPRRHGLGDGRPAARPGRGDHAVDVRRAVDGRVRVRRERGDHRLAECRQGLRQGPERADEVFSSAADTAAQYPKYQDQIIAGAKSAFLQGDDRAYLAGAIAVAVGAVIVFLLFPKRDDERRLLASYQAHDAQAAGTPA